MKIRVKWAHELKPGHYSLDYISMYFSKSKNAIIHVMKKLNVEKYYADKYHSNGKHQNIKVAFYKWEGLENHLKKLDNK